LTVGVPGIEDRAFADDQDRINGWVLKDVSWNVFGLFQPTVNLSTEFKVSIPTHYEDMDVSKFINVVAYDSARFQKYMA